MRSVRKSLLSFKLMTLLVVLCVFITGSSAMLQQLDFYQAQAIERLSRKGWIFGRIPDSKLNSLQRALLLIVPAHYLHIVDSANAPPVFDEGVITAAAKELKCVKRLEKFILNGLVLSKQDVVEIGNFVNCVELDLRYCLHKETEPELSRAIGSLANLETLRLSSYDFKANFLHKLPVLKRLSNVDLIGAHVENRDIAYLIGLPNLKNLDISKYSGLGDLLEACQIGSSIIIVSDDGKILRIRKDGHDALVKIKYRFDPEELF